MLEKKFRRTEKIRKKGISLGISESRMDCMMMAYGINKEDFFNDLWDYDLNEEQLEFVKSNFKW